MVKSEELIGTTDYLTLYTRCRINRYRYNRFRLYFEERTTGLGFYGSAQEPVNFCEHSDETLDVLKCYEFLM
jgi:hypothetical protein